MRIVLTFGPTDTQLAVDILFLSTINHVAIHKYGTCPFRVSKIYKFASISNVFSSCAENVYFVPSDH